MTFHNQIWIQNKTYFFDFFYITAFASVQHKSNTTTQLLHSLFPSNYSFRSKYFKTQSQNLNFRNLHTIFQHYNNSTFTQLLNSHTPIPPRTTYSKVPSPPAVSRFDTTHPLWSSRVHIIPVFWGGLPILPYFLKDDPLARVRHNTASHHHARHLVLSLHLTILHRPWKSLRTQYLIWMGPLLKGL